jgi:uncharacterized protein involved in oxidation of intracellular sulfur
MGKLLVVASHGPEDPNRATLAFLTAKAAKENGDEVTIFLLNDGVDLAREGMAKHIQGVGLAPLEEIFEICQILEIPMLVCKPCAEARGLTEDDLAEGAKLSGVYDLAKLSVESSVISF